MNRLDHIESPKEAFRAYKYFATITLPARYNRLGVNNQKSVMAKALKRLGSFYFESMLGCYELTKKGNIHAHLVVRPQEYFPDVVFETIEAKERAELMRMHSYMKQFSICDIQRVKNIDNVIEYIHKDVQVTAAVLNSSPYVRFKSRGDVQDIGVVEVAEDYKRSISMLDDNECCNDIKCNINC